MSTFNTKFGAGGHEHSHSEQVILLFDGVCNTCNFSVRFILKHDARERILFASLQSSVGQRLLKENKLLQDTGGVAPRFDSVILLAGDGIYYYSTAVFEVLKLLGWPWAAFGVFAILPRFVTDAMYRLFARNRYRLFGKSELCRIPSPAEKKRFLD